MRFGHKYGAKPTTIDNIRFASQAEARRYAELQLLVKIGRIRDLTLQPKYPLHVVKLYRNGWPIEIETVATYVGDFEYIECESGEIVTEDVKGFKTAAYLLKKKLVRAIHGIEIRETK
jgi:hypothetical protein